MVQLSGIVRAGSTGESVRTVKGEARGQGAHYHTRVIFSMADTRPGASPGPSRAPERDLNPYPFLFLLSSERDRSPDPLLFLPSSERDLNPHPFLFLLSPERDLNPDPLLFLPSPERDLNPDPFLSLFPR
ncbi:MAG: hypothetical protein HY815_18425 [Candidatus Riflebacteria bacterium]|nr:hypothetical protein [Candidatus Riflebacteria bacterium]